jgi:(2R)-sulfolactate sulfo-lyase subunit beta
LYGFDSLLDISLRMGCGHKRSFKLGRGKIDSLVQQRVEGFSVERSGDLKTIEKAARRAKEFLQRASEIRRDTFPFSKLTMSTKCGESDTTSSLASNPTVGRAFDRLAAAGVTLIFGETTEVTGGEDVIAEYCATTNSS